MIDLRVEAAVIADVGRCHADVIDGAGEQVRECLTRPNTLPPFVVAAAADVTSFADICTFDFDAARRLQNWARPYHQQTRGPHFDDRALFRRYRRQRTPRHHRRRGSLPGRLGPRRFHRRCPLVCGTAVRGPAR